jgi:hypothetical protein
MISVATDGRNPMRTNLVVAAALALFVLSCSRNDAPGGRKASEPGIGTERVELRVDDALLSGEDALAIIEPVYWTVNIYGSPQEYEASLKAFSRPQRLVLGLHAYIAEVNNGGHEQFYLNSSGIVWPDAIEGFTAIGVPEGALILRESAERLGGSPSLEREERNRQLQQRKPDFEDLDNRFDKLQGAVNLDARILEYARKQPSAFYFKGMVDRTVITQP